MLKKHLTIFVLLVMAIGVYAQSIPSGTGRYEALANSPFILDAAKDMFNNPAWNNYYRDYAFGDLGRSWVGDFELSDPYGGVTFGIGKQWNVGIIINKSSDMWDNFNNPRGLGRDSMYWPSNLRISSPIVPIMGLIGYTASKNLYVSLAPYIRMWNSSYENSDNDTNTVNGKEKLNSMSMGANLGFLYMIKKGWIEGAIGFRMNSFKSEVTSGTTTTTIDNDGGIQLNAGFRAWIYPSTKSKIAVVPIIGFYTYSFKPKLTSTVSLNGMNYSWLGFNGGIGLNWPVADDIQLAGGIKVDFNMFKADSGAVSLKRNNTTLPAFYFAGETRIADWLTGRFGFYRELSSWSDENIGTVNSSWTEKSSGSYTNSGYQTASIGAGFHFGRFSIDATVSEKWLKHGINFISGNNADNTDLFGVVSMSYNFAK